MITQRNITAQRPFYTSAVLTGSEKQSKWASDIRQKKLCQIAALRLDDSMPDMAYRLAQLRMIPTAGWWIVRRDKTPYALLKELVLQPIRVKKLPYTTPQETLTWASYLFDTIIIDTETTGLHGDVEIVEVSAIDLKGNVLLNTLVRPQKPIPSDATSIHGITDAMVFDAPTFSQVWPVLRALLSQYRVVIYNAQYDTRVIRNLAQKELLPYPSIVADCAMLAYSSYRQAPNEHGYDSYKWFKLCEAGDDLGVVVESKAHRSLADCLTTLGIIDRLKEIHSDMEIEYETVSWQEYNHEQ